MFRSHIAYGKLVPFLNWWLILSIFIYLYLITFIFLNEWTQTCWWSSKGASQWCNACSTDSGNDSANRSVSVPELSLVIHTSFWQWGGPSLEPVFNLSILCSCRKMQHSQHHGTVERKGSSMLMKTQQFLGDYIPMKTLLLLYAVYAN